ncbi:MAG: hypothetical protein RL742_156 [Bacteroidota bacterium]|jgi:hypothetical protein
MRNILFAGLFVALATAVLSSVFPWWVVWFAGLGAGLLWPRPARAAGAAFLGAFVVWSAMALWLDQQNHGILSAKIGLLLRGAQPWFLIVISGLLGGLLAAAGAWFGALLRQVTNK